MQCGPPPERKGGGERWRRSELTDEWRKNRVREASKTTVTVMKPPENGAATNERLCANTENEIEDTGKTGATVAPAATVNSMNPNVYRIEW